MSSPARLAIVSPQEVIRRGLTAMLSDHRSVVALAGWSPADARGSAVDVVLYDVIGLVDGGRDLDDLLADGVRVVAVGRDLRPDLAARALARGAVTAVSLASTTAQLLEAVAVALGSSGGDVVARAEDTGGDRAVLVGRPLGLTAREAEVLDLITRGWSNQEIAEGLYLSINSVKTYIRAAYRKLGVQTRAQAATFGVMNGFGTGERD